MTRDHRAAPGRRALSDDASSAAAPGRAIPRAPAPGRTSLIQPSLDAPGSGDSAESSGAPVDGGGTPLPDAVRDPLERSFGADFSGVRVHEGHQATALGALAYTRGEQLHFAPGRYQPHSASGRALLGHELTHVVQQTQGRVGATGAVGGVPLNADASLEHEADALGARAAAGERVGLPAVSGARTSSVVQRVTPEEIYELVTPDLGAPAAVIALMNDWLLAGYRMSLSALDRNQAASLWVSFHRWFMKHDKVPRPYTGGLRAVPAGPGIIGVVADEAMDEDHGHDKDEVVDDPMVEDGGVSLDEQDIIRALKGDVKRSRNGTQGVFFAGGYAIKADDGDVHDAIQLGTALGVPQPAPAFQVKHDTRLAKKITKRLTEIGAAPKGDTGFVVMRKVHGDDFTELDGHQKAMLDDPRLVADVGKLWTFLSLLGSTDDAFGDNKSNLMLQTQPTPALVGIDVQLDDMVDPDEAASWIEGLADKLEDRGLDHSPMKDLGAAAKDLGVGKHTKHLHRELLTGVISVLDAALRAATDAPTLARLGARGRNLLEAIASKSDAIARIKKFL